MGIYSYALSLTVVEYQTAILRGDLAAAESILPSVPADQRNRIARFLEAQSEFSRVPSLSLTRYEDLKELALSVSTDPDHRFELAVSLNDLETALTLVRESPEQGSQAKWKVVGDKALEAWQMDLAQESFEKAGDLPALLLLYTSLSDRSGLERLAKLAQSRGQHNIAFAAYLQLGDSGSCISLLSNTGSPKQLCLHDLTTRPRSLKWSNHGAPNWMKRARASSRRPLRIPRKIRSCSRRAGRGVACRMGKEAG